MTLRETNFSHNKIGCLHFISRKSKLPIRNSSLNWSENFKNAFSVSKSLIKSNDINSCGNKIKRLILAVSQSHIYIDNLKVINNHASFDFFNISRECNWKFIMQRFCRMIHLSSWFYHHQVLSSRIAHNFKIIFHVQHIS